MHIAKLPTPEETGEAIIEIWKDMNIRAGEIAPMQTVQVKLLGQGYRTKGMNAALEYMHKAGLIVPARAGFVRLTQEGYDPEPSNDEIKRVVLNAIGDLSIQPGDVVQRQPVWIKLMNQGYNGSEFANAIETMAAEGLVEMRNDAAFLTDAGFTAI